MSTMAVPKRNSRDKKMQRPTKTTDNRKIAKFDIKDWQNKHLNEKKDMLNEHYILGELPSSKLMKMKWNPVTGQTMNEVRYDVRGLNGLKNNYYTISDELYDIQSNIKEILNTTEGEEWADDNLGAGGIGKEIQIFKKIKQLFDKSKLGKVL